MSKFRIRNAIFLFILLVVTIISGMYFNQGLESFTSSSEQKRGQGIGDTYAAPVDLILNTDNTNTVGFGMSQIPTNM